MGHPATSASRIQQPTQIPAMRAVLPGRRGREWKVTPSQLVILQLQPASGDQYLPTMRAKRQEHLHTVLHNIRNKIATLWGTKYAVAGQ